MRYTVLVDDDLITNENQTEATNRRAGSLRVKPELLPLMVHEGCEITVLNVPYYICLYIVDSCGAAALQPTH